MKRFIVISFILFITFEANCQKVNSTKAFDFGEKLSYTIYYNWHFIWLHAAEVTFTVNKRYKRNVPIYHFDSYGKTLPNYDWFYKVNDRYQSYGDTANLIPFNSSRIVSEGKTLINNEIVFNNINSVIYCRTKINDDPTIFDTLKMAQPTRDVLSAVYLCRNIDFNKYKIGDSIPLQIVIDNELFELYIKFLGYYDITNYDGRSFHTIKFSVMLVEGTIFSGDEKMYVWITNDKNRIPVQVEAKILVGSIKAYVNEISK